MRKLTKLLAAIITTVLCSCTSSVDNVIKIFEDGIDAAQNATSLQELHDITVDVKEQLTKEGQKINGDKKMSEEDTQKAIEAQEKFYQAVEQANIRLGGGKARWSD